MTRELTHKILVNRLVLPSTPEIPAEAAVVLDCLADVPWVDDDAEHAEPEGLLGAGVLGVLW